VAAGTNAKMCYEFCIDFYKQLKVIAIVISKIKYCNVIVIDINVIDLCLVGYCRITCQ